MNMSGYASRPDADLERLAAGGDRDAFAELYNRHFDRVYDFSLRLLRDADEAADVAQETFLKAMAALSPKGKRAAFTTWLLTIARNTALNRLRARRGTVAAPSIDEADQPETVYRQIDADRLANPEEALEAKELAGLVWQAAAALDPKQYSLLDLHLRQGLDSGEIATMLGTSKNNAYVMLSRLRASVEESITAFIMARRGRRECAVLNELLEGRRVASFNADMKKAVARHIEGCSTCQEQRKKLVSPTAIFGALAAVPVPLGLKQQAMAKILGQWAVVAGSEAGEAGGFLSHLFHPVRAATGAAKQASWFAGWKAAALVTGTVVVVAGASGGALIYSGTLGGGQSGEQSVVPKPPTATVQIETPTVEASPTPEKKTLTPEEMRATADEITGLINKGFEGLNLTPQDFVDFAISTRIPVVGTEVETAEGIINYLNQCISDEPIDLLRGIIVKSGEKNFFTAKVGLCSEVAQVTFVLSNMPKSAGRVEFARANGLMADIERTRIVELASQSPSKDPQQDPQVYADQLMQQLFDIGHYYLPQDEKGRLKP